TAPAEVDPAFDDALGFLDGVGEERAINVGERCVAVAEVVVIVLDEGADPVGEGILAADADRPAAAGHVGGAPPDAVGIKKIVALPGAATLHIAEEAIPGIADAAGHRSQRLHRGLMDEGSKQRADVAGRGIGPGVVTGDADDPAACKLIVAASLDAP